MVKIMVLYSLEILSLVSVAIAILCSFAMSVFNLVKNIQSKMAGAQLKSELFDTQRKIFGSIKICSRCGFVFQFLAWLMFSSKQKGFIKLPELTYIFAILYASILIITIVLGIACKILNGKDNPTDFLTKRIVNYLLVSVLYFLITFLIG